MSLGKLKHSIRDKTRRTRGQSSQAIIVDMNRTMRGWFEYFKHSHRSTFNALQPHACGVTAKGGRDGNKVRSYNGAALSGVQKVAMLSWVAVPVKNATLFLRSPYFLGVSGTRLLIQPTT
jgi:hypothetical protein